MVLILLDSAMELLEDVTQHSRDHSPLLPLIPTAHGVCLTTARLPIGEDRPIVAVKTIIDHRLRYLLEHIFLLTLLRKDAIELELVCIFGI